MESLTRTLLLLPALACCSPSALAQTNPLAPTTGAINNLVVFIRFSDQPEFTLPVSHYEGLFNSAANSLKNYYLENSYNALSVTSSFYPAPAGGAVVSYRDAQPRAYYEAYDAATNPNGYQGSQSTAREAALVANALAAIEAQVPAGLKLDTDADGYIDHVTFEVYTSAAHPLPVLFYSRATYDTTGMLRFRDKRVGSYVWIGSAQDAPGEGSTLGATEIHEMGHSFGYPDLRSNDGRQPVGDWDVMANAARVVHSGAWLKHRFTNWIATLPEITAYGTYTLNNITLPTNNAWKLPLPNSSEFLVLEYRRAAGTFEQNLFGSGLCITRVNEAQGMWGNLDGAPWYLYYFRKDGTPSSDGLGNAWQGCLSAETGRVQFTDASNPACFGANGDPCGIALTNVGSAAGAAITFTVAAPGSVHAVRVLSGVLTHGGNRVGGATLTLSGGASGTTTTDSLGNYLFVVNDGGNYTLTPAKAGLSFSPAQASFTHVTRDQTRDFAAVSVSSTVLTASALNSTPGQSVTFTASVAGADAGTVTFTSGGSVLCSAVALANGQAACTTSNLQVGAHSIAAAYAGNALATASSSNVMTHTVAAPPVSDEPVVAAPGSTVTVSALSTRITLPAPAEPGNAPVTLVLGTRQVAVQPLHAGAQLSLRNGGTGTAELAALVVDGGRVEVTATVTQPVFLGTAASALNAQAGTRFTVDAAATALAVGAGRVTLAAGTFTEGTVAGGNLYGGEIAEFSAGGATQLRVGTFTGAGGAGDPLPLELPQRVSFAAQVPRLEGTVERLGNRSLLAALSAVAADASGLASTAARQDARGVLHLETGAGTLSAMPIGTLTIDTGRADGMRFLRDRIELSTAGIVATLAPSVRDLHDFATRLTQLAADAGAVVQANGTLSVTADGRHYAVQPGWLRTASSAAPGIRVRADGTIEYVDGGGHLQMLYPAFVDLAQLEAAFSSLLPGVAVTARGNGSYVANAGTQSYRLLPDYALTEVPAAQANAAWWREGEKFFVRYADGTAQGFRVQ